MDSGIQHLIKAGLQIHCNAWLNKLALSTLLLPLLLQSEMSEFRRAPPAQF
jgi:hypothetical protein